MIGRHTDREERISFVLPAGWEVEKDGEGGLLVSRPEGFGLLHLMSFERDADEEADPAEELYSFLAEHEIELEEEEVTDTELSPVGNLSSCEYVEEDEDEVVYWLVGVATAPGRLVFASYSCPAGGERDEVEAVRTLLASLSLESEVPEPPAGR